MPVTVKGMIENFFSMVRTYGFVPNGGRVYYLSRSQPPLLIPMVRIFPRTAALVPALLSRNFCVSDLYLVQDLLRNDLFFFVPCSLVGAPFSLNDANVFQVVKYVDHTQDFKFLKTNIALLEAEFEYWQNEKTVDVTKDGKTYKMAHYVVNSNGPRPESYK